MMDCSSTSSSGISSPPQPQLVRPQLYIASVRTEVSREVLQQNGITHILQVGVELVPSHPQHFTYLKLPIYDMPEQDIVSCFPAAFQFIDTGMRAGGGVLVHCQAGISRSATVVIAYCMWKEHLSADAATAVVSAARGAIWPNLGFKCQLQQFEKLHWDASRWQGWDMDRFLNTRYGDESVNFMTAMLGGSPQDRVSMQRRTQQHGQQHQQQQQPAQGPSAMAEPRFVRQGFATSSSSAGGLGAGSSVAAAVAATAAAASTDTPGMRLAAGSCGADQQRSGRHSARHLDKALSSIVASQRSSDCGAGNNRQGGNNNSGRRTRRMSYAVTSSNNGGSNGGNGHGTRAGRIRRHSTGQDLFAAAAAAAPIQWDALQQTPRPASGARLPKEAALMMAG